MPRTTQHRSLRLFCGLLLAFGLAGGAAAADAGEQVFTFASFAITRITLQDPAVPPVRYHLSKPARPKAPLVLYIQGSGCIPPFVGLDTPTRYSTIPSWLPLAQGGRYAVMAVDKPYQPDEPPKEQNGAIGCPAAFNEHFSYDAWLASLRTALRHALRRPEVDATRVLVIGLSEGAPMASGLARAMTEVTDVVLVGANGPTQLYDLAVNIHRSQDADEVKLLRLRELDAIFSAIRADPTNTAKFAWGHPYLRWSSFFAQSTLENLMHARARVYLVSGMQDNQVPILTTEALYAQLRAKGRDVSFRRVPNVGHSLVADGKPATDAQGEYDAFMAWFERR